MSDYSKNSVREAAKKAGLTESQASRLMKELNPSVSGLGPKGVKMPERCSRCSGMMVRPYNRQDFGPLH